MADDYNDRPRRSMTPRERVEAQNRQKGYGNYDRPGSRSAGRYDGYESRSTRSSYDERNARNGYDAQGAYDARDDYRGYRGYDDRNERGTRNNYDERGDYNARDDYRGYRGYEERSDYSSRSDRGIDTGYESAHRSSADRYEARRSSVERGETRRRTSEYGEPRRRTSEYAERDTRSQRPQRGTQRRTGQGSSQRSANRSASERPSSSRNANTQSKGGSIGSTILGFLSMAGSAIGRFAVRVWNMIRALPPRTLMIIAAAIVLIIIIAVAVRGCGAPAESQKETAPVEMVSASSGDTSPAATASRTGDTSSAVTATQVADTSSAEAASPTPAAASSKSDITAIRNGAKAGIKLGGDARKGDYSISFATTGDIMFARGVSDFIDENGGAAVLANVASEMTGADVTIANLECPMTNDESEALYGKDVLWRSNPGGIDGLTTAGIDIVSLANNHIMDYGGTGLKDTLDALDGAGILHAGAGMTEHDAEVPAELTVDGVSIAFFSWTDIIPDNFIAFDDNPGVVSARLNMDDACKRISEAKETHDVVIVAMHWGVEYQDYIDSALQEAPAHQLVDAGADIIWGNHPHVFEGIEFYEDALIAYSQGDFVCDHYSRETGESFVLKFDVTPNGIENVTVTPTYADDVTGVPYIVTGEEADSLLGRLETISDGMNSAFTIENDIAHVAPIQAETAA